MDLESRLDSFDPQTRASALCELAVTGVLARQPEKGFSNLHCHSFYSFNAYGFSPSRIVYNAWRNGHAAVGVVDFDVLDALEETLEAGSVLSVRAVCGLETRVFVKEYADEAINSPGEPGVSYFMGSGFFRRPGKGTPAEKTLGRLRATAGQRNRRMIGKINAFLKDLEIDYDRDVLPLTPAGNATERHILAALDEKAKGLFPDASRRAVFWAEKLKTDGGKTAALMENGPELRELLRAKLMKSGSPGYIAPEAGSFPSLEEVSEMIRACGALPTITWLDGTSGAEEKAGDYLSFMMEKGSLAVNVIPERNWNLKDPGERKLKTGKLAELVDSARRLGLPIVGGTEMNKYGQRLVDDFCAPELAPYLGDFTDGAHFMYGHTAMGRLFNKGFLDEWSVRKLPDRRRRNAFFTAVGKRLPPGGCFGRHEKLREDGLSPDKVLELVSA